MVMMPSADKTKDEVSTPENFTATFDKTLSMSYCISTIFSVIAIAGLVSPSQAQDWKVALGTGNFYLDTRTVQDHPTFRSAWIRSHRTTEAGILNVEFELWALCELEVIQRNRIVTWSHYSDHVVDETIPSESMFVSLPSPNEAENDFFEALCN